MPNPVENAQKAGLLSSLQALPNDSTKKTIIVALLLCLICSIVVASAAVLLKPLQIANKKTDKKRNILAVTGLAYDGKSIDELFEQFEVKVVDLETGDYAENIDPAVYDQRKAVRDPEQSTKLTSDQDIAGIIRRANLATVYLLKDGNNIKQIVLPVHGYGLWSTLYGFLALESDANTIHGLKFYEHAETPGLGGEVDNPRWRSQWLGKKAYDDNGEVRINVIRGHVVSELSGSEYQVDGLSGATLTSQGVSNLLNYWLGENGFGPYLKKIRSEG